MIPGAYAWSQEPLSSVTATDDVSTTNPLTRLLTNPETELNFLLRAVVGDPDEPGETEVYLSSGGYASLGDDGGQPYGVPNHQLFREALASPYGVRVNLLAGGQVRPSAVPTYGTVVINNPSGDLDGLVRLDWELREVTVWVGPRRWVGPTLRDFGVIFRGTIESVSWDVTQVTLELRDLSRRLDGDANPDAYLGYGTALRCRAPGDGASIPGGAWSRPTDPDTNPVLAVEFVVRPAEIRDSVLVSQGGAAGWRCMMHADGSVGLYVSSGANWVRTTAGACAVRRTTRLGFYGSTAGLLIRVDGAEAARNATPYAVSSSISDEPVLIAAVQ